MSEFWCERAWIGGQVIASVALNVTDDGRISKIFSGVEPGDRTRLEGLVYPGFANAHSHAFHRALRGKTQASGDFWSWREAMYRVANDLDPRSYLELATSTYKEMVMAGYTVVGEFHYLHNRPGGDFYFPLHAMGAAIKEAARNAGIRLTLLHACYLHGGIGVELSAAQKRFSDSEVEAWALRLYDPEVDANTRIGAAIHSVRAVTPDEIGEVVTHTAGLPLHVHVSEQEAENEAAQAAYGLSPTEILHRAGVLGPSTTAVHAIHTSSEDIEVLASSGTTVCACPTTEADLGDGIGPFSQMAAAGVPLAVGSDQHIRIDPFEEATRLEMDQRLATGVRGHFDGLALVKILTANGYRSLGWDDGGTIAVGSLCDLVAVQTESARTSDVDPEWMLLSAAPADVTAVVVGGRTIVRDGVHLLSAS